jgi:membrane protein
MGIFKAFFDRFFEHETPRLAASLAFYTLFGLAPLLLIFIAISTLLGVEVKSAFLVEVVRLAGPEAARAVHSILNDAENQIELTTWAGFYGVGLLSISASIIFSEVRLSFNKIFGVQSDQEQEAAWLSWAVGLLRRKFFSIISVFVFIVVLVATLFVSSIISASVKETGLTHIKYLSNIIAYLIYAFLFALSYKYIPARIISTLLAFKGGCITALMFVLGKEFISMYLGSTAIQSAYGAAGSFVAARRSLFDQRAATWHGDTAATRRG